MSTYIESIVNRAKTRSAMLSFYFQNPSDETEFRRCSVGVLSEFQNSNLKDAPQTLGWTFHPESAKIGDR